MKLFYHGNKEAINEKRKLKCMCECGSEHRLNDKLIHLKSLIHQLYEKQQTESQL